MKPSIVPNQPQPNLSLSDTTEVSCDSPGCDSNIFVPSVMFRKVSPIITGTGKPAIVPIEVFTCIKCKSPLNDLLPEVLKKSKLVS